jgi:DNA polymerase III subunit gamma/tau
LLAFQPPGWADEKKNHPRLNPAPSSPAPSAPTAARVPAFAPQHKADQSNKSNHLSALALDNKAVTATKNIANHPPADFASSSLVVAANSDTIFDKKQGLSQQNQAVAAPNFKTPSPPPSALALDLGTVWCDVVQDLIRAERITALVRELALQSQLLRQDTDTEPAVWHLQIENRLPNHHAGAAGTGTGPTRLAGAFGHSHWPRH